MLKHVIEAVSVAQDTDGLANDVAPANGVAMTLVANDAGDSLAHKVIITNNSATDYSGGGKTIVLVGFGPDGEAQTETIAGPAGSTTSTSTKYWSSLTSATPNFSRSTTDTFDIGWTADSVSPSSNPKLSRVPTFNLGFGCTVTNGTPTFTVQHSYDGSSWFNHSVVAAKSAAAEGSYTSPIAAIRLLFAAAGGVTLTGYQVEG